MIIKSIEKLLFKMNLNCYARTSISSSKNNFHFIQLYVQIAYRYTLFIQ